MMNDGRYGGGFVGGKGPDDPNDRLPPPKVGGGVPDKPGARPYVCQHCNYKTHIPDYQMQHLYQYLCPCGDWVEIKNQHLCDYCNRSFQSSLALWHHGWEHKEVSDQRDKVVNQNIDAINRYVGLLHKENERLREEKVGESMNVDNSEAIRRNKEIQEAMLYEALDRTHMVSQHLQNAMEDHPALEEEDLENEYIKAVNALESLYQAIGGKMS